MGREFVIEARGLVKRFADVVAVKGVDILVEEGEIYGLLGPNGAGKTTTIRMICGLIRPTRGTVRVFGYRMPEERIKASRLIGYVTQHTSLYEDLTVYENLMFYASVYGLRGSEKRRAVEEALNRFLLREFKDKMVGKLSGGTVKRVSLAVSMVHNPKLLILDEPTAGVDPKLRRVFWDMFRDLSREGLTLLVTTHYMDEAENCDRISLMLGGRIVVTGTPDEVKRMGMGGDVVEVTFRKPVVEEDVRRVGGVKSVEWVGDRGVRARVVVEDAEEFLANLLKADWLEVAVAARADVSLEEAFLRIEGAVR